MDMADHIDVIVLRFIVQTRRKRARSWEWLAKSLIILVMLFFIITFVISRSMFKMAISRSLCCPIEARRYDLILRRVEKDRSALQDVAGIAPNVLAGSEKHGRILIMPSL